MVAPSALNVIIVGLMMVIFVFFWRMIAAKLTEKGSAIGDAMAVVL
jgi:hypothetical protein